MLVPKVSLFQGSHISSVQWILYQKYWSDLQAQTSGEDCAFVWVNKLVTVLIRDSSWRPDRPHSLRKTGNSSWFITFLHSDQRQGRCTVLWKPLLFILCQLYNIHQNIFLFFTLSFQASSFSSMLHFIRFSQPCLAAVCFASCGLLVPTIRPSMTEWCHQVNITPTSHHCISPPDCPSVCWFYLSLSTVDCLWVSTGRYDDGSTPRGPWDRLQRLWS